MIGRQDTDTELRATGFGWQVPSWPERSACRDIDPAKVFPDNGRASRTVLDRCETCPVRDQCLATALESPWRPYGPWGGLAQGEVQTMWIARHPQNRSDEDSVLRALGTLR